MCITHELSTIRDADAILFFTKDKDSGVTTISGAGTYNELLQSCDTFRRWHEFKWPSGNDHGLGQGHGHDASGADRNQLRGGGAGGGASDDSVLMGLQRSSRDEDDGGLPTQPLPLQRAHTWSRGRTDDQVVQAEPISPGSTRRSHQRRQEEKLCLKQMQWQLQQQLRQSGDGDGESEEKAVARNGGGSSDASGDGNRHGLLFRSAGDFRGAQRRLDDMDTPAIARLLPQYEALLRQMQMRLRMSEWDRKHHACPWSRLLPMPMPIPSDRDHRDRDRNQGSGSVPSLSLAPLLPKANKAMLPEDDDELAPPPFLKRSLTHAPTRTSYQ
jgi:hypothetical protein